MSPVEPPPLVHAIQKQISPVIIQRRLLKLLHRVIPPATAGVRSHARCGHLR